MREPIHLSDGGVLRDYVRRWDLAPSVGYYGYAAPGSATSAAVWVIFKLTNDSSGNPSLEQTVGGIVAATAIWDNRAALSYS